MKSLFLNTEMINIDIDFKLKERFQKQVKQKVYDINGEFR